MVTDKTVGDLRSNVRSLGTRHAPVTRKVFRQPPRFPGSPPSSLPRFAASDDGGFERGEPPASLAPVMRLATWMAVASFGAVSPAQRGPQAPPVAAPPLASRAGEGSLRRGGQGLGTRWTADGRSRGERVYPRLGAADDRGSEGFRAVGKDRAEGRHFNPSGQGKMPERRLGQSWSNNRMVITGSPLSPGPTIIFNVVISASVDWPSRGTR